MRWIFSAALMVTAIGALAWFYKGIKKNTSKSIHQKNIPADDDAAYRKELLRLNSYADVIENFARQNNYNSRYTFLADMRLASGRKRFFIYDLKKDSVLDAGLVAHGSGSDFGDSLHFSNLPESNCTSIGKYKIGNSYNGKFGLAYKLYGLDKTNSNAFERFVVLHSHACVPSGEVSPQPICESWGCPTVAPSFLLTLKTYLDKTEKPMLLSIFY
ncbi:MAG: murein L,D-transpeptidase catalytic domain-containing protein [Ferruginibacter sp.]